MKNQTKELFAAEIEREAETRSVSEITVADICRACGATRQAFYYHFRDKYDLIAWIYMSDFSYSVEEAGDFSGDALSAMFQRLYSRKSFYQNAFSDHSQNNLLDYIQEYDTKFLLRILEKQYQIEPTAELQMALSYHSYGMTGLILEWLNGKTSRSAQQLADFFHRALRTLILQGR